MVETEKLISINRRHVGCHFLYCKASKRTLKAKWANIALFHKVPGVRLLKIEKFLLSISFQEIFYSIGKSPKLKVNLKIELDLKFKLNFELNLKFRIVRVYKECNLFGCQLCLRLVRFKTSKEFDTTKRSVVTKS